MANSSSVADYLLARLSERGVSHVFGVPGDYSLGLLDRILATDGVEWVGTTNELNAAYAADGYARRECARGGPGLGVLVTTLGVGELSAINGVAGSAAEQVPVLQITGAPATAVVDAAAAAHHTYGDGDFRRFARAYGEVVHARAWPTAADAPAEIDRVLTEALRHRMPVHLTLNADVVSAPCTPPVAPLEVAAGSDPRALEELTGYVRHRLDEAGGPGGVVVVAGHLADRYGRGADLRDLVAAGGVRSATLHRGKGVLDESDPRFLGLYAGELTPEVAEVVAAAPLVVGVGGVGPDGVVVFPAVPEDPARPVLVVEPGLVRAGADEFAPVALGDALAVITAELRRRPAESAPEVPAAVRREPDEDLDQQGLWATIERWLRPGDLLAAESGTPYYGALAIRLPAGAGFLAQGLWSSIGYTLPALLGAQLAAATDPGRAVLVIGDGSVQLTAQELGTFGRRGLAPVIVVVDNRGYTVERAIHHPDAAYHDVAAWDWQALPAALGLGDALVERVETAPALAAALDKARDDPHRPCVVQAVLPDRDAPELLTAVAAVVARRNAY